MRGPFCFCLDIQSDTKKNLKKVHQFEANINGLGLSIKVS